MKFGQSFRCLFWATLYCLLYLVSASDEDLVDFDFADLKEIDWNYNDGDSIADSNKNSNKDMMDMAGEDDKLQSNLVTFADDFDENENQVHPFDWRERILRTALSKALTNAALRQKFVEVMPILRVLSSQQRLALSALISAQVNARQGQELKLQQVRMMFGDDKKLLIPIVYDIANLVRNSARNFLHFDYDVVPSSQLKALQTPIARRTFELTSKEEQEEEAELGQGEAEPIDIGTLPSSRQAPTASDNGGGDGDESSLEDFFADMPADVLDPQRINEELQAADTKDPIGSSPSLSSSSSSSSSTSTTTTSTETPKTTAKLVARRRRSAEPVEFVHKLIRSIPLSVSEDDLMKGTAGRTVRWNSTAFVVPQSEGDREASAAPTSSTAGVAIVTPSPGQDPVGPSSPSLPSSPPPSYQEVEDLAFAGLNGTEVDLRPDATSATTAPETEEEPLPSPEELIAGPRYRLVSGGGGGGGGNKVRLMRPKVATKRKRVQILGRPRPKSPVAQPSAHAPAVVLPRKCERFTASMCIRADDYPL